MIIAGIGEMTGVPNALRDRIGRNARIGPRGQIGPIVQSVRIVPNGQSVLKDRIDRSGRSALNDPRSRSVHRAVDDV